MLRLCRHRVWYADMARMKNTKYKADGGTIHPIRVRQATFATIQGTEPTGDISSNVRAKISKSKREFGLRPRMVLIARTRGTGEDTFTEYATLPVLDPEDFNSSTGGWVQGSSLSYKTQTWEIVARYPQVPEDLKTDTTNSGGGQIV